MARILLITDIFPPDIGGPATYIDAIGHALCQLAHTVTVICTSDQQGDVADAQRPFRVWRIQRRNRIFIEVMARLVLALEMLRHKVILVNGLEFQAAQVAALLKRQYILKVVGDEVWELARNTGLTDLAIDDFQKIAPADIHLQRRLAWRRQTLSRARLVITPSKYLQRMVAGWGVPAERVRIVLNGVSLNEYSLFQPAPRSNQVLSVAFCGRLTNWKGVETLLLAAQPLPRLEISIIGDGPELPMLVGLSRQLKLTNRVQFLGRLPQPQLRQTLSKMHVLVLPSGYEGLSHTLLEAGALGLACIASDCGGNPEIIRHEENGLLIPYGDVAQLRAALEKMQTNENYRYQLACQAKANSYRFDFDNTVQQTVQILLNGYHLK